MPRPKFEFEYDDIKTPAINGTPPGRHIAAATYRGCTLGYKTNTCGIHAEDALIRAHFMRRYKNKPINIYVTRVHENNMFSRPCRFCSEKIVRWNPMATVFYTNKYGEWIRDEALNNSYVSPGDPRGNVPKFAICDVCN
jgi:deoxycytidylate deaminase